MVEANEAEDAAGKIGEVEVFVGRVGVFVREPEADEEARRVKRFGDGSHEWNGAAFTDKVNVGAEACLQRALGRAHGRMRERREEWPSPAVPSECQRDARGAERSQIGLRE